MNKMTFNTKMTIFSHHFGGSNPWNSQYCVITMTTLVGRSKNITPLAHSCKEFALTSSIWTDSTFENNLVINHNFTKYLKRICGLGSALCYSFKYSLKNALTTKLSPKWARVFLAATGINWRNLFKPEMSSLHFTCNEEIIRKIFKVLPIILKFAIVHSSFLPPPD